MSAVSRRQGTGVGGVVALLLAILAVAAVLSIWSIARWMSTGEVGFVSPVAAITQGEPWTAAHAGATVFVVVVLVVAGAVAVTVFARAARGRTPADRAAQYMGRGAEIAPLLPRELAKKHKRMGLDPQKYRGMPLGCTIVGNLPLRASYEATMTVVAGPGSGKSAALVIPSILRAPGAVLATSVKSDVLMTVGHRNKMGTVHIFDPQGIGVGFDNFRSWWNPLASIDTIEDAMQLATVFAAGSYTGRDDDAFFKKHGTDLVADYLFAAALDGRHLPVVFDWLNRAEDPTPARLLADLHPQLADRIRATQALTERTRSGVYAWAQGAMSFLASSSLRQWVVPGKGREFIPSVFSAAPADTLYLLSEEGPGSAGPLVAALTRAVLIAAENDAKRERTGRRPIPLVAVLDEAGNICRIPDLPAKYTFYRSMGIILITVLQSEEQGERVWPDGGFAQLWGASSVQVFGGGNASNSFLRNLSERIGDYHFNESNRSVSDGRTTISHSRRSERIMDVSDLDSLRSGRMIVLASGCRAVLIRAVPWFNDKAMTRLIDTTIELETADAA